MMHFHYFHVFNGAFLFAILLLLLVLSLAEDRGRAAVAVAAVALMVLMLCGCATCERHPTACAIGAVVASAVIIEAGHIDASHAHPLECSSTGSRVHCHQ